MNQEISSLENYPVDGKEDEINLSEYLHIISVYKWSILCFALVFTLITTLFVFALAPVFEATTTVLIESQEENIVSIEEVYGLPGGGSEYFETQNRIIQSRKLSEKVIDILNISKHPEYDPVLYEPNIIETFSSAITSRLRDEKEITPHAIRNEIVEKFRDNLKVSPIRNSQLINITFEAHDPTLTASVTNTLAELYIKSDQEGRLMITEKATGSITEQLAELKKNLEESEKALQDFREKEQLIDVKGVDSLTAKELDELTVELIQARRNRTEAETAYRQVVALKGQPVEAYETIPAVLKDVGLQNAKDVQSESERKVSELKKRYGPKHPKMIAAQEELSTANKNVEIQILNIVESIKKEFEVARAKEGHLSGAMSRTKKDMGEINRIESRLLTLERDVDANRNIYETFLSRYKETSAVSEIQPVNARVVDPAVIPSEPAKPKKGLIILISLIMSLFIGIVAAFLIESMDNALQNEQDVEDKLHLPVLGGLPKLKVWRNKKVKVYRYYTEHNSTVFSENIRTIRSGLLLTSLNEKKKVFLVTSTIPGEGKSITAVNLAFSLGQIAKVLLIDCDLRRPSMREVFELDSDDVGLSHFIMGTHTLQESLHYYEKGNIYVMPAGVIPPNPLEMLSSERFKKAIENLKNKFDYIIIDSAPSIAVSDAVVLSQLVNHVIYLVKAGSTPYQLAWEGIKHLKRVKAPIAGVVLNQVITGKKPKRYGYYKGHSYDNYGYGES